eukprot:c4332_g1_i2.p1 GENE.c4332_g1_i2~~c4332_g1_i2.p1  ORF type:complete len:147 (+),score=48.38 c4332_g1_i2:193-633(+)
MLERGFNPKLTSRKQERNAMMKMMRETNVEDKDKAHELRVLKMMEERKKNRATGSGGDIPSLCKRKSDSESEDRRAKRDEKDEQEREEKRRKKDEKRRKKEKKEKKKEKKEKEKKEKEKRRSSSSSSDSDSDDSSRRHSRSDYSPK